MFQSKSFQALVLAIVVLQMPMAIATAADYPRPAYSFGAINQEGGAVASGDPGQNCGGVEGGCSNMLRNSCMSLIFRIDAFPEEEGLLKWTLARNDFGGEHGLGLDWGRPVPYLSGGAVIPLGGGIATSAQVVVSGGGLEYFGVGGSSPDFVATPFSRAANVALHEGAADEWTYSFRDKQSGALQQYEFTWDANTAYGTSKCEKHIDEHGRETEAHYNTGGTNRDQVAKLRRVEEDGTDGVITEVRVGYYGSGHAEDFVKYAVLRRATRTAIGGSWATTWGRGDYDEQTPTDPYGDTAWGDSYNIRRVRYYYYNNPDYTQDDDYGNDGALKMVIVQRSADGVSAPDADTEADWTNVKVWYFRYLDDTGDASQDGLVRYIIEPAWFARMDAHG